jgi:hypothetical protein
MFSVLIFQTCPRLAMRTAQYGKVICQCTGVKSPHYMGGQQRAFQAAVVIVPALPSLTGSSLTKKAAKLGEAWRLTKN